MVPCWSTTLRTSRPSPKWNYGDESSCSASTGRRRFRSCAWAARWTCPVRRARKRKSGRPPGAAHVGFCTRRPATARALPWPWNVNALALENKKRRRAHRAAVIVTTTRALVEAKADLNAQTADAVTRAASPQGRCRLSSNVLSLKSARESPLPRGRPGGRPSSRLLRLD